MQQYSTDLREAVMRALDTGAAPTEVARLFGVSRATVYSWAARVRQRGSVAASGRSGRPPKLDAAAQQLLRQRVAEHPEETLRERCAVLAEQHALSISEATMSRTLAKLQITYKKRPSGPGSKPPPRLQPGWPSAPPSIRAR